MKKKLTKAAIDQKIHPYPTPAMKELFEAVLHIRSPHEAAEFFRDLLTIAELQEFANRWQMVKRIQKGKSYLEIAQELGTSTTTVTRVAHWFYEGAGGYKTIAQRAFGKNPEYKKRKGFQLRGKHTLLKDPYSMEE